MEYCAEPLVINIIALDGTAAGEKKATRFYKIYMSANTRTRLCTKCWWMGMMGKKEKKNVYGTDEKCMEKW